MIDRDPHPHLVVASLLSIESPGAMRIRSTRSPAWGGQSSIDRCQAARADAQHSTAKKQSIVRPFGEEARRQARGLSPHPPPRARADSSSLPVAVIDATTPNRQKWGQTNTGFTPSSIYTKESRTHKRTNNGIEEAVLLSSSFALLFLSEGRLWPLSCIEIALLLRAALAL